MLGINIKNLGKVKSADISLAPLTIVVGPNSTGKTYLCYAIYSFIKNIVSLAGTKPIAHLVTRVIRDGSLEISTTELIELRSALLSACSNAFQKSAHEYFSTDRNQFSEFYFNATSNNEVIEKNNMKGSVALDTGVAEYSISLTPESGLKITLNSSSNTATSYADAYLNHLITRDLAVAIISLSHNLVFPVTAERTGISLFYKELDLNRTRIFEELTTARDKSLDRSRLIDIVLNRTSRYAEPIRDNIDYVRDIDSISKQSSFLHLTEEGRSVLESMDELLGGRISRTDGNLGFVTKGVESDVPIYLASSAVKSLVGMDIFLKHVATNRSFLVMDEPELNLHPASQRKIARLIVRAVNCGINVFLTTHSDWFVREISVSIQLSKITPDELSKLEIRPEDTIEPSKVNAYQACNDGIIKKLSVSEVGIDCDSLDEVVLQANSFYDRIDSMTRR